jgi:hypothetical protein
MLCYAMLCYAMLCYAMLCYVMLCYVMLCYVMLCYMLCYVMLCYVMLCYVVLCCVVLCCAVLCCAVLCCVVLCCVVLCCVVLCYKLFTCRTSSSHSFLALPHSFCTVKKFSKSLSFMMDWAWSCPSKNPLLLGRGISSIFDQKPQYFVKIHITFLFLQIFYQNFLPRIRLPRVISRSTCPKVEALCKTICTWNLKCSLSKQKTQNVLKFDYFWMID